MQCLADLGFTGGNNIIRPYEKAYIKIAERKTIGKEPIDVFLAQVHGEEAAVFRTTICLLHKLGQPGIKMHTNDWRYMNNHGLIYGPFPLTQLIMWKTSAQIQSVMVQSHSAGLWMTFPHLMDVTEHVYQYVASQKPVSMPNLRKKENGEQSSEKSVPSMEQETHGASEEKKHDVPSTLAGRVKTPVSTERHGGIEFPMASREIAKPAPMLKEESPQPSPSQRLALPPPTVETDGGSFGTPSRATPLSYTPPPAAMLTALPETNVQPEKSSTQSVKRALLPQPPIPPKPPVLPPWCHPPAVAYSTLVPKISTAEQHEAQSVPLPLIPPSVEPSRALSPVSSDPFIPTISPMLPFGQSDAFSPPTHLLAPIPVKPTVDLSKSPSTSAPRANIQDLMLSNVAAFDSASVPNPTNASRRSDPPVITQQEASSRSMPAFTPQPRELNPGQSIDSSTDILDLEPTDVVYEEFSFSTTRKQLPILSCFSFSEFPPDYADSTRPFPICSAFLDEPPVLTKTAVVDTSGIWIQPNDQDDVQSEINTVSEATPWQPSIDHADQSRSNLLPPPQTVYGSQSPSPRCARGWGTPISDPPSTSDSRQLSPPRSNTRNSIQTRISSRQSSGWDRDENRGRSTSRLGMNRRGGSGSGRGFTTSTPSFDSYRHRSEPCIHAAVEDLLRQISNSATADYTGSNKQWESLLERTQQCVLDGFGDVVRYAFHTTYGKLWKQVIMIEPPWTGKDIFSLIFSHRSAVFNKIMSISAVEMAEHLKLVHMNLQKCSPTAENVVKIISWTSDLFGLFSFKPMKNTAVIQLRYSEPNAVTFEEANRRLLKAKEDVSSIFDDCRRVVAQLSRGGGGVGGSSSVGGAVGWSETDPKPPQEPATGRGFTGRPGDHIYNTRSSVFTPDMSASTSDRNQWGTSAVSPSPSHSPTDRSPREAEHSNPSSKDIMWIREAAREVTGHPRHAYDHLMCVKKMVELVTNKATASKSEIINDPKKAAGLRDVKDKISCIVSSLISVEDQIQSNQINTKSVIAILTAMKDFITVVHSDAYKYCSKLQRPEDRYVREFQSRLAEGKNEPLRQTIQFFDAQYKKLRTMVP